MHTPGANSPSPSARQPRPLSSRARTDSGGNGEDHEVTARHGADCTGKLDAWRRFVAAVLGERREAYETAIREGGLTRLRVWHHRGPAGADTAVVQYDGSAPERFLERIMTATDDFAKWFRAQGAECHGFGPSSPPPPPPELVVDVSV